MVKNKKRIAIQGYPGSFHDEVCRLHYGEEINVFPADTFDHLANMLTDQKVDHGVMAIENSIAGTILQNYRILREAGLWIVGEKYLRIQHNLLVYPGVDKNEIREVHSHPMAINQCLHFLNTMKDVKIVETTDTALSAWKVREEQKRHIASISSLKAAELYGLEVLNESIESDKTNYTRFFFLSKDRVETKDDANKASFYIKIPDVKGQLLKILRIIDDHNLNMSKLQSFPVAGKMREYFFHIDVEFDVLDQYTLLKKDLINICDDYTELGIYKRDFLDNI